MKSTLAFVLLALSMTASHATIIYGFNFTRNGDGFVNVQTNGSPRAFTTAFGTDLWTDSGTWGVNNNPTSGTKAMVGGLSVTWSVGGTWASGVPSPEPGDQSGTAYKDYLDDGAVVTISGLAGLGVDYDLTVFQNTDFATSFRPAAVTETVGGASLGSIGSSATNGSAGALRGSGILEDLSADSITLTFQGRNGSQRSTISAFTIAIPEPASAVMIGLGGIMMTLRRRRI